MDAQIWSLVVLFIFGSVFVAVVGGLALSGMAHLEKEYAQTGPSGPGG